VIIKICGITDLNILEFCEKNHVDFFGMIFYNQSPRNITVNKAYELIKAAENYNIKAVGVFVNKDIDNLINIIKKINLKYVQLHGNEDQNYINLIKKKLNIKIIKKISIHNKDDFRLVNDYKNIDYFLFDYKPLKNELPGGNAKKFDWSLLKNLNIDKPWLLSGGINASNVNKIYKFAKPDGIDLSSGVEESLGIKNVIMIKALLNNI